MNIYVYTIIIIAISVTFSTVVNVLITKKVIEMATIELEKMENRWFKLIDKLTN